MLDELDRTQFLKSDLQILSVVNTISNIQGN